MRSGNALPTVGLAADRSRAAELMDEPAGLDELRRRLLRRDHHVPDDEEVRRYVRYRAREICEYCLLPTEGRYEVDHSVPPAHWDANVRGRLRALGHPSDPPPTADQLGNYAWACPFCNNAKGRAVAGRAGRRQYRLFNPRVDQWPEHFAFAPGFVFLDGLTDIGRTTELALRFNEPRPRARLEARVASVLAGRYPPAWARGWRSG